MLDEQMDDMIRAAADQHHPTYNDMAWEKMQAKLDAQLPQKEPNRKLLWIFLLFIVAGGAFFAGRHFNNNASSNASITANGIPNPDKKNEIEKQSPAAVIAARVDNQITPATNPIISNASTVASITQLSTGNEKLINSNASKMSRGKTRANIKPASTVAEETIESGNALVNKEQSGKVEYVIPPTPVATTGSIDEKLAHSNTDSVTNKDAVKPTEKSIAVTSTKEKEKKKQKITSTAGLHNLGLSFSVGPEKSFVSKETAGATSIIYGIGLSYNIGKRLTVASGFYAVKKIYSADSAYYKIPSGFFPANYRVNAIDANCTVYEIPLSLYYRFGNTSKHQWLLGAGISSLLMKKETYDYDYKYSTGVANYHKSYTIQNENKHWLSVLALSGGYQYQLSRQVSFSAMPYIKLPLTGVGFGKVKLNSGGILFTATVKPFYRKP